MRKNQNTESIDKEPKVFYSPGIYSITLNPQDKFQYLGQANRLEKFRDMINELFLCWPELGIDYVLHIELSEPRGNMIHQSSGPRLHIHGTFKLRTNKAVFNFLIKEIYSLLRIGNLDIDTINDFDKWNTYCLKQFRVFPKNKHVISNLILENQTVKEYFMTSNNIK